MPIFVPIISASLGSFGYRALIVGTTFLAISAPRKKQIDIALNSEQQQDDYPDSRKKYIVSLD